MTRERFVEILASCRLRTFCGSFDLPPGLLIHGIEPQEMTDILTLAGQSLGEIAKDSRLNPEYLLLGPEADMHLLFHPEALKHLPDSDDKQ